MSYDFIHNSKTHPGLSAKDVHKLVYPFKSFAWVRDNLSFITQYNEANPDKPLSWNTTGVSMAEAYRKQRGAGLSRAASRRSPFAGTVSK